MTKARTLADNFAADINGITAGTGITGGGTSGTVTITNDMATTIDAKGDLVVGTGADTYDNLAAGVNGETLVADSSATTGLRWQGDYAAGKNRIINGNMVIDQRNTATTPISINAAAVTGTIDRWAGVGVATDGVYTMGQDSSAPSGFSKSLKVTVTTADTSITGSQNYQVRQSIEGYNVIDFDFGTANAKTVTLSFWVRSSLTGTFGGSIRNNDANRSYPFSYSISAADTWEKKTITITGDTTGTWNKTTEGGFGLVFSMGAGPDRLGTAGAWVAANNTGVTGQVQLISTLNATWYLTGVQVEIGNVATAFQTATGTYAGELAACQRYYWRSNSGLTYTALSNVGTAISTTQAIVTLPQKVSLRATPTVIDYGNLGLSADGMASAAIAVTAAAFSNANITSAEVQNILVTATGLTQYRPYALYANNNTAGYIAIGAEL